MRRASEANRCNPWSTGATALVAVFLAAFPVRAQQAWYSDELPVSPPFELPIEPGSVPLRESSVGYIDSALPRTNFSLRFEDNRKAERPTRSEFLLAFPQPVGRGLPLDESRLDDQRFSGRLEYAFGPKFSVFTEIAGRMVDPEINANASGFDDLNAGFKWAFLWTEHRVYCGQLRVYAPTGDSQAGIGVGHTVVEPGFLLMHRITERFRMEKELRLAIPVDGADGAAGTVFRYGISVGYDVVDRDWLRVAPTFELVCSTAFGGRIRYLTPGGVVEKDASGDTIWNGVGGCRVSFGTEGRHQLYAGFLQPLTGERWHSYGARIEYRLAY